MATALSFELLGADQTKMLTRNIWFVELREMECGRDVPVVSLLFRNEPVALKYHNRGQSTHNLIHSH